ncbi:N-acetyltransferase [Paenibacillus sp. BC26]|uniref:GNAT family N-acetyltransferase n=1 Tax=Paenibacillus sp. BC26 TaxID=1881032 RepID=UPI0008DF9AAD|nr:GNAT family N-acetyltransferase [Paenibacillus sp. BC26]SFS76580.1 Acetyltransferase (GNAT) family protein [Paenibacillus sp. BC26]
MGKDPAGRVQTKSKTVNFNNADFFMVRREAVFMGFIALNWGFSTTKGQPFLRIQDLYVLPQFRKKGIAKLLVDKAIEVARQNNANRLQLNTGTNNESARSLYKTLGFEWFPEKVIYMYFLC